MKSSNGGIDRISEGLIAYLGDKLNDSIIKKQLVGC
jgi:hypothetical protein